MWTLIALAICLTWAAILKAQGHAWSTVIMRPLIGLGALMLATVFHAIAFVAFGIALPHAHITRIEAVAYSSDARRAAASFRDRPK